MDRRDRPKIARPLLLITWLIGNGTAVSVRLIFVVVLKAHDTTKREELAGRHVPAIDAKPVSDAPERPLRILQVVAVAQLES